MSDLVKKTKLGERRLYRLKQRGVFGHARKLGRDVSYDIEKCARAIERYARTGQIG